MHAITISWGMNQRRTGRVYRELEEKKGGVILCNYNFSI